MAGGIQKRKMPVRTKRKYESEEEVQSSMPLAQYEEEQDDDIVEISTPKKLKKRAKLELKKQFPKLPNIRSSPTPLVNAIEMMNEAQKQAVKDLGFGRLLDLKITQCSYHIVDWVI